MSEDGVQSMANNYALATDKRRNNLLN